MKIGRITARSSFADLRRTRHRAKRGGLRLSYVDDGSSQVSVAFAINRKVGGAVLRNRLRRRSREIFRSASPPLRPGLYLVTFTSEAAAHNYEQLRGLVLAVAREASADR